MILLLGLSIFRDFGVNWDEQNNYYYGHLTLNRMGLSSAPPGNPDFYNPNPARPLVFGGTETKTSQFEYTHGPFFEALLALGEKTFGLTDSQTIHFFRHAMVFVCFWGGLLCFFFLCLKLFESRLFAFLGVGMFLLSPRIFHHAFHNSFDISFMVFYLISFFCFIRYLEKPSLNTVLLWAVAFAMTCGIRIVGLSLVPVFLLGVFWEHLFSKKILAHAAVFIGVFAVLLYQFWPSLWGNPLVQFWTAIQMTVNDPWQGQQLYFGKLLWQNKIPWHFSFVWVFITTPVFYTLFFLLGVSKLKPGSTHQKHRFLIYGFLSFLVPLAAVVLLNSTVFNGWRHFLFIYPGFLLVALLGIQSVTRMRFQKLVFGTFGLSLALTAGFLWLSHPHQGVYFNFAIGGPKVGAQNFEIGYWGTEYREALEYIVANDPSEKIQVKMPHGAALTVLFNNKILPKSDRKRLKFIYVVEPKSGDYMVYNHQFKIGTSFYDEVWSKEVFGVKILSVYRRKPWFIEGWS